MSECCPQDVEQRIEMNASKSRSIFHQTLQYNKPNSESMVKHKSSVTFHFFIIVFAFECLFSDPCIFQSAVSFLTFDALFVNLLPSLAHSSLTVIPYFQSCPKYNE